MNRGRVEIVEFRWWVHAGFEAVGIARTWLRLTRQHLPAALPRRYDVIEPSRFSLDDGGDAFAQFLQDADDDFIHFSTHRPAAGGQLAHPTHGRARFRTHALSLFADSLNDATFQQAVRGFFVEFALESKAIVATGELLRDWNWSGRNLGYILRVSEVGADVVRGERWSGLPPYPVWWSWFGPDYVPRVRPHLDPAHCQTSGPGLFHWRSVAPANRDQLRAQVEKAARASAVAGGGASSWLPPNSS